LYFRYHVDSLNFFLLYALLNAQQSINYHRW
jgi:hypothetical protein